MKLKILSAVILITILSSQVKAQDYKTALGVKFYPGGITLKHFLTNKVALEGIGYFYNHGTRITGLYEIHFDIAKAGNLRWYVGPGAHIGFYNSNNGGATSIGVDGVIGLDFKIPSAPINLSLDWQPSIEFGDNFGHGFSGGWGGFAIRYTF